LQDGVAGVSRFTDTTAAADDDDDDHHEDIFLPWLPPAG